MAVVNKEVLEQMRKVDIETVDAAMLKDLSLIEIDHRLPLQERIKAYIEAIENPYCFKVGDTVVHLKFSDTEVSLTQRIADYLSML